MTELVDQVDSEIIQLAEAVGAMPVASEVVAAAQNSTVEHASHFDRDNPNVAAENVEALRVAGTDSTADYQLNDTPTLA